MIKFDDIEIIDNNLRLYDDNISKDDSIQVIRFKDIEFSEITFKNVDIEYNSNEINFSRLAGGSDDSDYDLYFENCNFNEQLVFNNMVNKFLRFENCSFNDILFKDFTINNIKENGVSGVILNKIKSSKISSITIDNCEFSGKFYINKQYDETTDKKSIEINTLSIKDTEFKSNFKLHNCKVDAIELKDTDFEKNADFYLSHFKQGLNKGELQNEISFKALNFRGLALFGETQFDQKFNLQYVTIEGYSHFRKAIFKEGLDLDYVNIQNEMNFYGIDIINKDTISQETYRIIKHNFEKLGNKIEANEYHALELKEKGKILNSEKGDWKERLVFNIHNWSSEHSTNWLLVLLWIVVVGFTSAILTSEPLLLLFVPLIFMYAVCNFESLTSILLLFIFGFSILLFFDNDLTIKSVMNYMAIISLTNSDFVLIQNFSNDKILSSWDAIVLFLNKVSLGYLYYQFLMSVRKDTRK